MSDGYPFGVQRKINISVCQDTDEAIRRGFVYDPPIKPIEIERAVVVCDGMQSGRSTVDFLLVDEAGNKYVVMITGALLKSIPC